MNKAHVLEQQGQFAQALSTLEEATPALELCGGPHLLFALRFNTVANLWHLERHEEAAALLPSVRELAAQQGNELSLIRVLWLDARLAAAQGRGGEAMPTLEQVRGDFTAHALPYDAALSSLDLAMLWLERGCSAEVRDLARGLAWVFKSQGIHREALAALAIFCEAARQEVATVELTRRVIADIEKVQRLASPYGMEGSIKSRSGR